MFPPPSKSNVQQRLHGLAAKAVVPAARFIFYLFNTTTMEYLVNTDKDTNLPANLTNIDKLTHQLCQNIRDQQ